MVCCDNQKEIDRLFSALLDDGVPERCGWLTDRYGISWQITATVLGDMLADPDRAKAKRAMEAMLQMQKIDIATLEKSFDKEQLR